MTISKSQRYRQRARDILAGGGSCRGACLGADGCLPLMMACASGSKCYDTDGREYTDYYLGAGAHILGHANRNVVLSAKKHAERGIGFGMTTQAEVDLAAYLMKQIPSLEKVRFVNSGTEAVLGAVRLARYATGRRGVVSFQGADHGFYECTEEDDSAGEIADGGPCGMKMVLPYNDLDSLRRLIGRRAKDAACILLTPVLVDQGLTPVDQAFLSEIVRLSREQGIILIFDEVMTGFRGFPGGAQSVLNIKPDLTCLGSVIGGGFPLGVYGGRADLMQKIAPDGGLRQAGLLSASPVILRAGLMALRLMTDDFYRALNTKAQQFADRMNAFFKNEEAPAVIDRYYSMMALRFLDPDLRARCAGIFEYFLKRGIIFPAGEEGQLFFFSGRHSKKEIAQFGQTLEDFFCQIKTGER